ncbi:MAG TPA: hypothetical protein VN851_26985 [Thermoanaerobaculia bacterium]|nr:hypothetical protein [Thermoanaerobaculia bacterium]
MRVRIALLCLFASLVAGVAFAAPAAPAAPPLPEVSGVAAPAAPSFLLPPADGSNGAVWMSAACDFRLNKCLSHCNGEVDCETICNCVWWSCTYGPPLPNGC